jgi:23S rRNA (adenine2503-C2)-methyltransferase
MALAFDEKEPVTRAASDRPTHLLGLSAPALGDVVASLGQPAYRGKQLFTALHRRRMRSFDEMTDLPIAFRSQLSDAATASSLTITSRYLSSDGTRRYLMKTWDGLPVETVFIPEERRDTICFSSQSGCPLQCDFCLTAKLGLLRSLTAAEMVEQVIVALNDAYGVGQPTPRGTNLVAMGAGEPFLNFEALMDALSLMSAKEGLHIVPNRGTVSTAGVVPKIKQLAATPNRPHLAVSLGAPTDKQRDVLMPINKRWPLSQLLTACKEFESSLKPGERFTFEYVLLADVNDSDDHARRLANLINRHGLRAKINLIPHNPADGLPYQPSTEERTAAFRAILSSKGVDSYVRRPRGRDILAACGQLAAKAMSNE